MLKENIKIKKSVGRPRLSDEERKERLKESNRKYYEKKRLLIEKTDEEKPKLPVGRPRLSDEERKERLKESNRKYYEKMRLLIKKAKSI